MGNPVKGEVSFEAEGERYTLVLDFNALCTLEEELDLPVAKLGEAMASGRVTTLRTVFRAGLAAHHPDLTVGDAGEIIQTVGAAKAADLIGEAFKRANPAGGEGGDSASPRKNRSAGTGTRS